MTMSIQEKDAAKIKKGNRLFAVLAFKKFGTLLDYT